MNTNYHTLFGENIAEKGDGSSEYQEYRRKWHENPEKGIVGGFPLFLDIEATSACNLKCPHCLQSHADFKPGYMPWDLYEGIIDEASDNGCYGCKYHTIGRGEPTLHPRLAESVAYAKKKGLIDVALNTNGTLMTEKLAVALLDAGLDRISFSIDGLYEYYETHRWRSEFWDVSAKVIRFFELRTARNYRTKIRVQTVRLPDLDLFDYKEFWEDFCDEVGVVDLKDMTRREYGVKGAWVCPQPWQRLSVLWDGAILPCNHDDQEFGRLGYFPEMPLKKAWHGAGMRMVREAQRSGRAELVAACNGCFLRTAELKREKGL